MISNNHHSSGSAWTNLSGLELPNLRNMIQSSKKEFNTNTQLSDFSLFSVGNSIPGSLNHCSTNKDFTDYSQDVSFNHCNRNSRASSSKASNESLPMNWMIDSASVSSRDEFELSKDSSLGIDQWLSLPSESIEFSAEARFECLSPRDRIIEVLSNPMLDCSQIEKVVVMKYKAKMVEELNLQKQSLWAQPAPVPNVSGKKFLPRCKFCYNNNEEDVYHNFKVPNCFYLTDFEFDVNFTLIYFLK